MDCASPSSASKEWALTGSARYGAELNETQHAGIALNVNLDSVAGSARLAAQQLCRPSGPWRAVTMRRPICYSP